jgi:hypothetical protein
VAVTLSSGRTLPVIITVAGACRAGATGRNLICGKRKIAVTRFEGRESDALRTMRLAICSLGGSSVARPAEISPHARTSISLSHLWQAAVANCLTRDSFTI